MADVSKNDREKLKEKAEELGFETEEWRWLSADIASPAYALSMFNRVFLRLTYDEPEKDDSKQFISATHLHTDDVLVCYKRDVGLDNVAIYVVKDLRWQGGLDRASWDDGYEYLIELIDIKRADEIVGLKDYLMELEKEV